MPNLAADVVIHAKARETMFDPIILSPRGDRFGAKQLLKALEAVLRVMKDSNLPAMSFGHPWLLELIQEIPLLPEERSEQWRARMIGCVNAIKDSGTGPVSHACAMCLADLRLMEEWNKNGGYVQLAICLEIQGMPVDLLDLEKALRDEVDTWANGMTRGKAAPIEIGTRSETLDFELLVPDFDHLTSYHLLIAMDEIHKLLLETGQKSLAIFLTEVAGLRRQTPESLRQIESSGHGAKILDFTERLEAALSKLVPIYLGRILPFLELTREMIGKSRSVQEFQTPELLRVTLPIVGDLKEVLDASSSIREIFVSCLEMAKEDTAEKYGYVKVEQTVISYHPASPNE